MRVHAHASSSSSERTARTERTEQWPSKALADKRRQFLLHELLCAIPPAHAETIVLQAVLGERRVDADCFLRVGVGGDQFRARRKRSPRKGTKWCADTRSTARLGLKPCSASATISRRMRSAASSTSAR